MVYLPKPGGSEEHDHASRVTVLRGVPVLPKGGGDVARVLTREDAEIELVAVNTDEEARRLRFPGSPTIRIDGEDLFPVPDRTGYALGCRMYATTEGLKGAPTAAMLREALAERNLVPGVS